MAVDAAVPATRPYRNFFIAGHCSGDRSASRIRKWRRTPNALLDITGLWEKPADTTVSSGQSRRNFVAGSWQSTPRRRINNIQTQLLVSGDRSVMRYVVVTGVALALFASASLTAPPAYSADSGSKALVEFEMMTWPEVKDALAAGKTTALIYTGGVEQRGPQNVNGGHNIMAHAIVKEIALRLGNAIAMPVLPITPNNASAELPGTIGLTNDLLEKVLERMVEQTVVTGFKNVVVMGDHGGGQGEGDKNVYRKVAAAMDAKYSPSGVHVYYCDQVYEPANHAMEEKLAAQGYPKGSHAGIHDTSIMMYLDHHNAYVRKSLLPTAVGIPLGADGKPQRSADAPKNGIVGDARRSSAAIGKEAFEMKVDYAVKQIQTFIPPKK
jgi:creatinine amidohydrolase/Fe(II)-dependent formamide hydrolase-like protein